MYELRFELEDGTVHDFRAPEHAVTMHDDGTIEVSNPIFTDPNTEAELRKTIRAPALWRIIRVEDVAEIFPRTRMRITALDERLKLAPALASRRPTDEHQ